MPGLAVKLYGVLFKFHLKHTLQNLIRSSLGDSNPFGITSRPNEVIAAANPSFSEGHGIATKDIHIDPLSSLSVRIFLPDVISESSTHDNNDTGIYRGYLPSVGNRRENCRKLPVVLQLHGGGFVSGSNNSVANDIFCKRIAKLCDVIVIAVGYRLAPENRYPAAFEDGLKVLNWLAKQANLADCSKSIGNTRHFGGDLRRSDVNRQLSDGFGASMIEPWLATHGDPSRFHLRFYPSHIPISVFCYIFLDATVEMIHTLLERPRIYKFVGKFTLVECKSNLFS